MGIRTILIVIAATTSCVGVAHAERIAPPPVSLRVARPVASPATWVTSQDYPVSAMHNGESGTAVFLLDVDANGLVSNCRITRSSGSATLDVATCDVVSQRARFHPVRNSRGKAVPGTYTNAMRWQIPQSNPAPVDGYATGTRNRNDRYCPRLTGDCF